MVLSGSVLKKENVMIHGVDVKKTKKDLMTRFVSSLVFIPIIALFIAMSYEFSLILCAVVYLMMLYELFSVKTSEGHTLLFVAGAFSCLLGIIGFAYCRLHLGVAGCGYLICVTCCTDIGAYLFGKTFGGPKLCPQISPNKTWAGFFGGILFSNFVFYGFYVAFLKNSAFDTIFVENGVNIFVLTQGIILASVAGDLLESCFKRKIGVKDMGTLLPGHGGLLDRLDSLLFTSMLLALVSGFLLEIA